MPQLASTPPSPLSPPSPCSSASVSSLSLPGIPCEGLPNRMSEEPPNTAEPALAPPAAVTAPETTSATHPGASCQSPVRPRFFLDLFAGKHAPCTAAVQKLGLAHFIPFDMVRDPAMNILNPVAYRLLLRLAWTGIIAFLLSAPPSGEFSRLKLHKPGPKPLRTPEHMDGVPGLAPDEQRKVYESTEIHRRSRALLRAVHNMGGDILFEQPPSSMAWLQPDNIHLCQEIAATCAYVSACMHGLDVCKSWAFCGSSPRTAKLAATCNHNAGSHANLSNKWNADGKFLSFGSSEYPPSLAAQIAQVARPFLDMSCKPAHSFSDIADLLPEEFVPRRLPLCDGAGLRSTADHSGPAKPCNTPAMHSIDKLADAMLTYMFQQDIAQRLPTHLSQGLPTHPCSDAQQMDLAELTASIIMPHVPPEQALQIQPGQPLRLNLLHGLAQATQDPDHALPDKGSPRGLSLRCRAASNGYKTCQNCTLEKNLSMNISCIAQETGPQRQLTQHCSSNW